MALKSDGTLWAWGDNDYGQLGDGTTTRRYTPVQVLSGVQAIAAGARHSLALKSDGTLWAWGDNSVGDLGDGTTIDRHTPVQVLSGVQAVASRGFHSLALKSDGTLWAWGDNAYGQLGDGTTINSSTPVQVLSDVQAIAAGFNHSLAVKSNGTLWAWGDNDWGQLGDGTMTRRYTPVQVLSGVQAVAGGGAHSLALKSDDTLWAWGYNGDGELGDGTTTNSITPVQAQGLSGVQDIAAGYLFSLTLKSDGTLLAWGDNSSGQLGDGTAADSSTPVQVLSGVQAAAAGIVHGLALKSDGTLWAWGYNGSGQLGDGTVGTDRYSPVQVVFPQTDAEAVAADKATMAIGYAAGDSASGVTQNVTLPTGGASGTTISWTSDNTAITVSGSNGAVTRPGYSAGDATVTLTATISKGAATDTRIYVLTVIAQEETASSNADLSGLTLSNGTLSPVFAAGTLNYTASVANNVSAVTVTATVYDVVNATVTASVYNGAGMLMSGPISLTTGAPSGSLPLNEGNNTIKVVVTAEDGTTQTYLVIVSRNSDTSSPGPTSTGGISDSSTEFLVIINGKEHGQIVEEAVTQEGRQNVLTLTVDASRLADLLAKEVDKSVVIIPAALSENAEKVTVELTGDAVKAMENKQADLEVQTANGNYKLPAAQVFIDQIASQLGGQAKLSDIVIHVSIAKSDAEKVKLVEST
ncbi:immunoglobulin-like domain-containing protein, partial [Cohnella suwonensis]